MRPQAREKLDKAAVVLLLGLLKIQHCLVRQHEQPSAWETRDRLMVLV